MLFSVLILPLAFVAVLIQLLLKKRYRGLLLGLALFVATVLVGLWAVLQSRSSTAVIGILFLPSYGIFAAGMDWLAGCRQIYAVHSEKCYAAWAGFASP